MIVSRKSRRSSGTVIGISPAASSGLLLALHGDGDGQVDLGEQADRGPAVPGPPADDLPGVQASALLGELMIFPS
jgi:hypothetical protein